MYRTRCYITFPKGVLTDRELRDGHDKFLVGTKFLCSKLEWIRKMQVRLGKILIVAITLMTFLLVLVHTFYQSYGNNLSFFNDDADEKIQIFHIEDKKPNAPTPKPTSTREQRLKFKPPTKGEKNIIFIETSCVPNATAPVTVISGLILNDQKACALESAATTNPNASIHLFYSCPLNEDSLGRSDKLVQRVFDYPNVHVWHQSIASVFQDTPLEALYKSGRIQASRYPTTHASDVLRFLLLWKYGGVYLDLDFIVMRSLDALGPNFVGIESSNYMNSAALGLGSDALGEQIAQECVEELRTDFRGDDWGHNGPGLITRVMKRRCGTDKTDLMTREACEGFSVLPTSAFYPIYYEDWRLYYTETDSSQTLARIRPAFALHLWNSMKVIDANKQSVTIQKGSRQPIAVLQQEFCSSVSALAEGE